MPIQDWSLPIFWKINKKWSWPKAAEVDAEIERLLHMKILPQISVKKVNLEKRE